MSRWPEVDLGDLATCLDSRRVPIKEDERPPNGTVPYYGANGQVGWMNTLLFDEPLLLIAEDGGFFDQPEKGVAYLISGPSWVNNHAHVLRPNPSKVRLEFLGYFFRHFNFLPYITGTTRSKLTQKDLFKVKVPLPSLPEQERIVRILNEVDQLRRLRAEAGRHTADLIPAMFHEMFATMVLDGKRLKLSDCCDEIYRYPTYYGIKYEAKGVPEIRGELIKDDFTIDTSPERLRFISSDTSERFPRTVLRIGDIVMSVRGTIGKMGLVPAELEGANITANLIRISPIRSLLDTTYLISFMAFGSGLKQVEQVSSSTTIQTIQASDLKQITILLPPFDRQRAYASHMAEIHALKAVQTASHQRLDDLFNSLLHLAFQGGL